MPSHRTTGVAVLGAGLIGLDLLDKIRRSPLLDCRLVAGRNSQTLGLRRAAEMGYPTTDGGITALMESIDGIAVVFDASNADSHAEHWCHLEPTNALLVDLTPSGLGTATIPTVNGADALTERHVGLVSCGGQAAIPILHALAQHQTPRYVEVVSTGASRSAGRATRLNLDEYIHTTQQAARHFTGAPTAKVLVNISPATTPPSFRVTLTCLVDAPDPETIRSLVADAAHRVQQFVPGYAVTALEIAAERVTATVEVTATGRRIPAHAGNLEIINAAAIQVAEVRAGTHPTRGARS
ncbi:acetylating acetaldehyde dehydrogenase [Streptomyces sp. CBMA123]|uniref:acetylating acetaldehyde dehydrogenase n=1 Tax=Streptomyces sp. CBMA123 TaxID=1896313 RepID=UPI001661F930|nr:acetaldehyde dehydrogenase (acetylating) [Streptomyces sp. CBMA123]MBD0693921.1 acetaldehyde dehydrogenase (acetylating) [Streptomyces sp. CBMA123]